MIVIGRGSATRRGVQGETETQERTETSSRWTEKRHTLCEVPRHDCDWASEVFARGSVVSGGQVDDGVDDEVPGEEAMEMRTISVPCAG